MISTYQNQKNFGLLNLNIDSLNQHIADRSNFLNLLKFDFPVITLNEHKIGPVHQSTIFLYLTSYFVNIKPKVHITGFLFQKNFFILIFSYFINFNHITPLLQKLRNDNKHFC